MIQTNLRELRTQAGFSIKAAQERTGLNRGTLSQLERGVRVPTEAERRRLVEVYGPARWWVEIEADIPAARRAGR